MVSAIARVSIVCILLRRGYVVRTCRVFRIIMCPKNFPYVVAGYAVCHDHKSFEWMCWYNVYKGKFGM